MELWLDALLIIITAILFDIVISEVPNAVHPLRWMGNILCAIDGKIKDRSRRINRLYGLLSYLLVLLLFGTLFFLITSSVRHFISGTAGEIAWIVSVALLFKICFAMTSFRHHCSPIQKSLRDGNIEDAASKVQMIVSRNTKGMDAGHIASSCTETTSENYVDSVVSPTAYFGLLGIFGALMFRCANLMDAMWGYKNEKYGNLGFFPAKLDDVLSYIFARISVVFIAMGAFLLRMDWRAAIPAALKEHDKTPSPNSGWPMTAFAAALEISMEKKDVYVMGSGPLPTAGDVSRCCRLLEVSSILFMLMVSFPLFAFLGIHVQICIEDLFIRLFEMIA